MKNIVCRLTLIMALSCGGSSHRSINSIELISNLGKQDLLFRSLLAIASTIPETVRKDSLAFLILPVQVSCPACRKKTIDSIIKRQEQLLPNHFIIICANGGRKIMGSYFKEEKAELPVNNTQVYFDSINAAYKYDLYEDKPTLYYAHNSKAYKKVAAVPATVKEDLREFFSGYRNNTK